MKITTTTTHTHEAEIKNPATMDIRVHKQSGDARILILHTGMHNRGQVSVHLEAVSDLIEALQEMVSLHIEEQGLKSKDNPK